jgi:hypothetical protein
VGAATYVLAALLLGSEEVRGLLRLLWKRGIGMSESGPGI